MVQLTNKGHYSEEVPTDAEQLSCSVQDDGIPCLTYFSGQNIEPTVICLPPGSWRFLFTTKGVTEVQAASVVQIISNAKISGRPQYRRYDRDLTKEMPAKCWTRDSRHALETLLLSKSCDPNKNYAIIQKQTTNGTTE